MVSVWPCTPSGCTTSTVTVSPGHGPPLGSFAPDASCWCTTGMPRERHVPHRADVEPPHLDPRHPLRRRELDGRLRLEHRGPGDLRRGRRHVHQRLAVLHAQSLVVTDSPASSGTSSTTAAPVGVRRVTRVSTRPLQARAPACAPPARRAAACPSAAPLAWPFVVRALRESCRSSSASAVLVQAVERPAVELRLHAVRLERQRHLHRVARAAAAPRAPPGARPRVTASHRRPSLERYSADGRLAVDQHRLGHPVLWRCRAAASRSRRRASTSSRSRSVLGRRLEHQPRARRAGRRALRLLQQALLQLRRAISGRGVVLRARRAARRAPRRRARSRPGGRHCADGEALRLRSGRTECDVGLAAPRSAAGRARLSRRLHAATTPARTPPGKPSTHSSEQREQQHAQEARAARFAVGPMQPRATAAGLRCTGPE